MPFRQIHYIIAGVGIVLIAFTVLLINGFLSVPRDIQRCYQIDMETGTKDVQNIKDKKVNTEAMCKDWKKRIEDRVACIDRIRDTNLFARIVSVPRDEVLEGKAMQRAACKDFPKTLVK